MNVMYLWFRLFTLDLHSKHKILSRWKLSQCCGPVDGSLGAGVLF